MVSINLRRKMAAQHPVFFPRINPEISVPKAEFVCWKLLLVICGWNNDRSNPWGWRASLFGR